MYTDSICAAAEMAGGTRGRVSESTVGKVGCRDERQWFGSDGLLTQNAGDRTSRTVRKGKQRSERAQEAGSLCERATGVRRRTGRRKKKEPRLSVAREVRRVVRCCRVNDLRFGVAVHARSQGATNGNVPRRAKRRIRRRLSVQVSR